MAYASASKALCWNPSGSVGRSPPGGLPSACRPHLAGSKPGTTCPDGAPMPHAAAVQRALSHFSAMTWPGKLRPVPHCWPSISSLSFTAATTMSRFVKADQYRVLSYRTEFLLFQPVQQSSTSCIGGNYDTWTGRKKAPHRHRGDPVQPQRGRRRHSKDQAQCSVHCHSDSHSLVNANVAMPDLVIIH